MRIAAPEAEQMRDCLTAGGVVVFPTDTVYGIGCNPEAAAAVERVYELKGRPPARPAAVMFFSLAAALLELPELREREGAAVRALLPGPVTILIPNRARRFPLACGTDGIDVLGLRVPELAPALRALQTVDLPLMQSSANISGQTEARRFGDIAAGLREGADLAIDGGELSGVASTVVDLCAYEDHGEWRIRREGAMGRADVERVLANC